MKSFRRIIIFSVLACLSAEFSKAAAPTKAPPTCPDVAKLTPLMVDNTDKTIKTLNFDRKWGVIYGMSTGRWGVYHYLQSELSHEHTPTIYLEGSSQWELFPQSNPEIEVWGTRCYYDVYTPMSWAPHPESNLFWKFELYQWEVFPTKSADCIHDPKTPC